MQYSSLEEAFYDYSPKESIVERFSSPETAAPVLPILASVPVRNDPVPDTPFTSSVPCEHCVLTRRKTDNNSALILVLFFLIILLLIKR